MNIVLFIASKRSLCRLRNSIMMMMLWHENTFRIIGHLWQKSTGHWWIPFEMRSSYIYAEQTVDVPMIWDVIMPMALSWHMYVVMDLLCTPSSVIFWWLSYEWYLLDEYKYNMLLSAFKVRHCDQMFVTTRKWYKEHFFGIYLWIQDLFVISFSNKRLWRRSVLYGPVSI